MPHKGAGYPADTDRAMGNNASTAALSLSRVLRASALGSIAVLAVQWWALLG